MKFAHFTTPDGRVVSIRPDQVEDVEDNDQGIYDKRAKSVIFMTAGFHAVRETREQVEKMLEAAGG